jgi:hypothetical protein
LDSIKGSSPPTFFSPPPLTMTGTSDNSRPTGSQGLHATTEPALTPEFLRLLLRLHDERNTGCIESSARHTSRSTTTSDYNACFDRRSRGSARCSEGQSRLNATPSTERVGRFEFLNSATPPVERVGRFESLNDVQGRELRVFRKSPCPPRSRSSSVTYSE